MTKLVIVLGLALLAAAATVLTAYADVVVVSHPVQKISVGVTMDYSGHVVDVAYVGNPPVRTMYAQEDPAHAQDVRYFQWINSPTPPNGNYTLCVSHGLTDQLGNTYWFYANYGGPC